MFLFDPHLISHLNLSDWQRESNNITRHGSGTKITFSKDINHHNSNPGPIVKPHT
jgi:hypothetical protein